MKIGLRQIFLIAIAFSFFPAQILLAQSMSLKDNVPFYQDGQALNSPFAGGLNLPQFSTIDLDGDGNLDLFVYDRSGNKVLTFINGNTANTIDYTYDPSYISAFPDGMDHFALLRDFNCDGLPDIFTNKDNFLKLYENVGSTGNHSFQFLLDSLGSDRGMGTAPMYVFYEDIPALEDIDLDGDLDIITFDAAGAYLEFHRNTAIENGDCSQFALELADACWGNFYESALNNQIFLNATCKGGGSGLGPQGTNIHGGSTVAAFDENGDQDYDLYVGDLLYNGITFMRNAGNTNAANIDSVDYFFPSYDSPVDMFLFPAMYFMDVNNDGLTDGISAPNAGNVSLDFENVWFYQNTGTTTQAIFSRVKKDFLQEDMVDVGRGASPVFFDHDNDGLLDILIGNFSYKTSQSSKFPSLTYYRNTGTQNNPEYTLITRDYMNLSQAFNPQVSGYHPSFGDLDNDGDKDMILGDYTGEIHFFENISPVWDTARFVLSQAKYKGIDVGQFAAPQLVDVDRDGKLDLVIGETGGNLNYHRNIGTFNVADFSSTPTDETWGNAFSNPDCCTGYSIPFIYEDGSKKYSLLIASEAGNIKYFPDIENGDTTFAMTDSVFGDIDEGTRTSICGADIDNDNKFEWVVGNIRGGIAIYESEIFVSTPNALTFGLNLYPNPASDRIRLNASGEQLQRLELYDLQGKMVLSRNLNGSSEAEIHLQNLSTGMYLLKVSNRTGQEIVRKIIKE